MVILYVSELQTFSLVPLKILSAYVEANLLKRKTVECAPLWYNSVAKHRQKKIIGCFYSAACLAPPTDSCIGKWRERQTHVYAETNW